MGIITNGILGGVSGKIGGVVGFSWKGIDVLRSYVVPADPQTEDQVTERTLFGAIGSIAKLLLATVVQPFWDPFAVKMSGFNLFMSVNRGLTTDPFNPLDLRVAQGSLESETIATCAIDSGDITLTWSASGLGNGEDTDKAYGVIIDMEHDVAFVTDGSDTRVDETMEITVGEGRTTAQLKAFLFFARGSGETLTVSNSDSFQVVDV